MQDNTLVNSSQAARKPVSEAHNRQETPLFAKSIERHALKNNNPADVESFAELT